MTTHLQQSVDAILHKAVSGHPAVPGVVAMATDRRGIIYEGAAGKRALGEDAPMTLDTVFSIWSTTKAVTATAVLQLVEEGRLDLDAPARTYVPAIGELQVLDGFDADGKPKTRAPKRDITTRMLLLHTAGMGYDIFNEHYFKLTSSGYAPGVGSCQLASLKTPLLFDPGEQWEYGSNIDWAGQVVEAITGDRLGAVMQEKIFAPLGMTSTAFSMTPDMRSRVAKTHQRNADGSLTTLDFALPAAPDVDMGGHGLHSTVPDYIRFIRMWLNDGAGDHGQVLKPETVRMAEKNGLGEMKIKGLPGVIAPLSNAAEFFPGLSKSWALSFMVNDEPAPTGRPAGALAWAGLANLYFWIDRKTGVGGFWATQIFPFADPTSVGGYLDFETAVYQSVSVRQAA